MLRSLVSVSPLLLLAACPPAPEDTGGEPDTLGVALRADGWLRGDLHVHTDYEGGFDDVATNVRLGEYLRDPVFLAAHPEYTGNHLDFLAITDHRTVAQQDDPGYQSDKLVLVGGEEFGSGGHAGLHGVHTFVDHDPEGDGIDLDDVRAAVVATQAQGAAFSPNHPMLPGIPWPWDTEGHDGIEVWNSGWALMAPPFSPGELATWEASHGPASPLFHRAIAEQGVTSSQQALTWYEAHLARGRHAAVIGGSDRHAVLMPGVPTVWVRTASTDEAGVVQGIRDRHTFVSRNPVAAQVLVEVEHAGATWEMGDEIPIPEAGAEVVVRVTVARADGGLLRVVGGGAVESDEALADAELGTLLREEVVHGERDVVEWTLPVLPGDWLYPKVLEPLVAPGLSTEEAEHIRRMAAEVARTQPEDFLGIGQLFAELIDPDVLFHAEECDPEAWDPARLQCVTADDEGLATFFVPDRYDRAVNVVIEDGEITDWCMGAVGSAVRFVAE